MATTATPTRQWDEREIAIAAEIAWAYGVTMEELLGPQRTERIARARLALYAALERECHLNDCEIGRLLNRHPSTVLYGIRAFKGQAKRKARKKP